jgi:hypothetical protein
MQLTPEQRAEQEKYGPDKPLDTAAMVAGISLIGVLIFLLWT